MRARQKFVGENSSSIRTTNRLVANTNREWDPGTGVQVPNPDSADASATTNVVGQAIANGADQLHQQVRSDDHAESQELRPGERALLRGDPLSETSRQRAASTRSLSGTASRRYNYADGFPVITDWDDPMQYSCQANALLGIGDVTTHRDKNLHDGTWTTERGRPRPASVTAGTTINVNRRPEDRAARRHRIPTPFSGRENSAFMAVPCIRLAHQGPALGSGGQTDGIDLLGGRARGAGARAALSKSVLARRPSMAASMCPRTTSRTTRTARSRRRCGAAARPCRRAIRDRKISYVAGEADKIVENLTRAFARIAAETLGAGTALACELDPDRKRTLSVFQAQFFSGTWRGDLRAFSVTANGALSTNPIVDMPASRSPEVTPASSTHLFLQPRKAAATAERYRAFLTWDNLGSTQKTALSSRGCRGLLARRSH